MSFSPNPSKIICVGLNYLDHAKEMRMHPPKEPLIFLKAPSAAIRNGEKIILPHQSAQVEFEAELGIVIGKRCKNVTARDAQSVISGYTCVNDVTARDLQKRDGQWSRAKSFDTFCPVGQELAVLSIAEAGNLRIQCFLNGELRQDSNTRNLIFGIAALVEFVSASMTLENGDIISTGTPAGSGRLAKGDKIEVRIEKIGSLVNSVVGQ